MASSSKRVDSPVLKLKLFQCCFLGNFHSEISTGLLFVCLFLSDLTVFVVRVIITEIGFGFLVSLVNSLCLGVVFFSALISAWVYVVGFLFFFFFCMEAILVFF